jgi:hypothetical protein
VYTVVCSHVDLWLLEVIVPLLLPKKKLVLYLYLFVHFLANHPLRPSLIQVRVAPPAELILDDEVHQFRAPLATCELISYYFP